MAKLGEICKIESGGTPSRSKKEYWENGTIPWIKIADMNGKYVEHCSEYITEIGLNNSSAKLFDKDTILISIFATLGEVSILKYPATTNQAIAGVKVKVDYIINDYLYYYLLSLKPKINRLGRGVAQNNINLSILRNLEINIPEIEIQNIIVKKLDLINKMIKSLECQLIDLDLLIKSRYCKRMSEEVAA